MDFPPDNLVKESCVESADRDVLRLLKIAEQCGALDALQQWSGDPTPGKDAKPSLDHANTQVRVPSNLATLGRCEGSLQGGLIRSMTCYWATRAARSDSGKTITQPAFS